MIRDIQREIGSSMLFVTHDMAVHANIADRLGIMYAGRLVEEGRDRRDLPQRRGIPTPAHSSRACRASATTRQAQGLTARRPTSPIRRPAAASIRAARSRWTSAAARSRPMLDDRRRAIASPASRVSAGAGA